MDLVMCYKCNVWYSSERELRDHRMLSHREFSLEEMVPSLVLHNQGHLRTQQNTSNHQDGSA